MGKKILIIDDESTLIEVMKMCLESNGYEVITATDGESGLLLWQQENPDLILLDCVMPIMDGTAVVEQSMNRDDLPSTPIIMLSAKDDACIAVKTNKIVDRLSKPCGYDDLLEKIEKHIRKGEIQ